MDRHVGCEVPGHPVFIKVRREPVEFDGRSGFPHPYSRLFQEYGELVFLQVGVAQRGAGDGQEHAQVIENEGDFARFEPDEVVQGRHSGDQRHPAIDENEGPEPDHLGQPGDAAFAGLRREPHHDGERDGIAEAGEGRPDVHHPFEGADFPAQQEHRDDDRQQAAHHDVVDGGRKLAPVDGAGGHLQHQAFEKKAPSDEEAFRHSPGLVTHIV